MNRQQANAFVKAVAHGATIHAHPETARLMKEFIGPIEECEWLEEGTMYAVDCPNLGLKFQLPVLKLED